MENTGEVILTFTSGYRKFKSQSYGLIKKVKNALKNGFGFSEIVKMTKQIDSCLSSINGIYF